MGKVTLGIDIAKAFFAKGLKSSGTYDFATALKDAKLFMKPINGSLPKSLREIFGSRVGLYKIAPEEKVIDALKGITTKGGKPKYAEEALRTQLKKVNMGLGQKLNMEQYTDIRCREITMFAERSDVNLHDVAEFSLLPENSYAFANSLSNDRFKIFKEFMKYTQGDEFHILKIGETSPRRFSVRQLRQISGEMTEEGIQKLRKLVDIKRPEVPFVFKGEYVFSGDELMRIADTNGLDVNEVARLAKTSGLKGNSICNIASVENMDLDKASNVINKIKKSHNGDVCFNVERDVYEPTKFRLQEWSKANDKQVLIKTFDNNMNLISTDKIVPVVGKQNQAKIIGKDFEVVLEAHSVPRKHSAPLNEKIVEIISETRQIRNAEGKLLRTEYLTPSEVSGLHNWKAVMPDGTVKPIIDIKKSKKGILTVKKDLEALDGTITKSNYKKLSDGSWAMRLNISKDGKILSKRNVKHKILTPNEAESVVNGKKFKVSYSSDEIKVLNAKGATDCIIDLKSLIDANNTLENAAKLKNMLKECSADELQIVSKKLKQLEFNSNDIDAFADCHIGKISCGSDIFTFRHEMGHIDDLFGTAPGKDMACQGIYSTSKDFKKVYSQELNMFMKEFPNTQREYVDYFINHSNFDTRKQSFQETAAELIAADKSPNICRLLGTRTEYLERYFPQTRSLFANV